MNVTRVERQELLSVENLNFKKTIARYQRQRRVHMEDTYTKGVLPVHVILGASSYAKLKTCELQRTGAIGEPVAEYIGIHLNTLHLGGLLCPQGLEQMWIACF